MEKGFLLASFLAAAKAYINCVCSELLAYWCCYTVNVYLLLSAYTNNMFFLLINATTALSNHLKCSQTKFDIHFLKVSARI
jgi:hypothetical protein